MLALRPKHEPQLQRKQTRGLPSLPRAYRSYQGIRWSTNRRANRGGTRFATLIVLAAMATGGVYAYRHFFHRSGEAATQLIPADTLVVVTLDVTPSAAQVPVFKRIGDALKTEHLDTTLEDAIGRAGGSSPLARDVRPFATGSFAYALLKTSAAEGSAGSLGKGDSVWFATITDANRVQEALNRDAQKNTVNGLDYYTVGSEQRCMAVMGSYLVTADKPADLAHIEATRKGETPAISSLSDYQEARAALPADSNIMLFVSETALAQTTQAAQNMQIPSGSGSGSGDLLTGVRNPMRRTRYLAMGFAVHDKGIDSVMLMPAEPPSGADGQEISHIAPFDADLFRKMPSGAYGIMALSQPGKYYHFATALGNADSHFRHTLDDGVSRFERETSLSVMRDILPATNGNVALAIYPDADNPGQNVDGLLVIDDANGADPASLADRVRSYVERASTQHGGHAWRYTSENRNGVLVWTLNPEAQQEIQRSLGSGVSQARGQAGIGGQGTGDRGQDNPFALPSPAPDSNFPGDQNNGQNRNPGNGPNGDSNTENNTDANRNDRSDTEGGGNNGANDHPNNGNAPSNPNDANNSNNLNNGGNADGADRRGGNGGLLQNGSSSRHGDDTDVHIHAGSDGRVYDDTFDLHHGDDRVHADRNGVNAQTREGDSLRINRNGLSIHSHDGDHVEINRNGVDIHAHDNGNVPNGSGNSPGGTGQSQSMRNSGQNGGAQNDFGQPGTRMNVPTTSRPDSEIQQAMRNKTIAYAQIGHVLLIASSRRMLDRAIAAYQNGSGTMADDPGYAQMRQQMTTGAQNAILLNLPAILEAARPVLSQTLDNSGAGFRAEDILHLAGDPGNGLVATQQYDGKTFKTTCFLPVDYEKAIHLIGVGSRR